MYSFKLFSFQLIPGYRGYTVDSLKKLNILDDIMISLSFQLIPGYRGYTVDSLKKLNILDDIMISLSFQLIPGYRGYTVDSLKKLNILDDIMISADERHYFKGLARRRGLYLPFQFVLRIEIHIFSLHWMMKNISYFNACEAQRLALDDEKISYFNVYEAQRLALDLEKHSLF